MAGWALAAGGSAVTTRAKAGGLCASNVGLAWAAAGGVRPLGGRVGGGRALRVAYTSVLRLAMTPAFW